MPKLSLVVPVYREAGSLQANFQLLHGVLSQYRDLFTFELIFVNDGSPDDSLAILESIHRDHPGTVGVVNLVRNFGQVPAIFAGLAACSGDCAAVISADLQDPPELLPVMFEKWRAGARTVLAERGAREDSLASRVSSRIFYRLMNAYALPAIPPTGFDFFLIDRSVIVRMLAKPEPNGFLQGQVLYASGQFVSIPYTRKKRLTGQSGWTFSKKLKYFIDGFIAYSFMPMRIISLAGLLLFCLGILASIALVFQRLRFGTGSSGWTSVMIVIVLLHGTEMLMIGVVGEYLWRTLEQARGRPLYLVDYQKLPECD
jgi:glycosyltransferase involved in cell wall biosynthesis